MHAICLQDKELGAREIQSSHAPWLELVSAFPLKSLFINFRRHETPNLHLQQVRNACCPPNPYISAVEHQSQISVFKNQQPTI